MQMGFRLCMLLFTNLCIYQIQTIFYREKTILSILVHAARISFRNAKHLAHYYEITNVQKNPVGTRLNFLEKLLYLLPID